MKKIAYLLELAAIVLAVFGGIGYTITAGAYVITAAIVFLGVMILPTVKDLWKKLNS